MQLELSAARRLVADALLAATGGLAAEPHLGFGCSLGVAALYRVLALLSLQEGTGHELALRYQHLATVWATWRSSGIPLGGVGR